jgi:hypothetical protein
MTLEQWIIIVLLLLTIGKQWFDFCDWLTGKDNGKK